MIAVVVALLGFFGSIIAALITAHSQRRPAALAAEVPADVKVSDYVHSLWPVTPAFWWGIASCVAWIIPIFGFPVCAVGLCLAIRDNKRQFRRVPAAFVLCIVFLVLTMINSAIGAYEGAHGTLFAQG